MELYAGDRVLVNNALYHVLISTQPRDKQVRLIASGDRKNRPLIKVASIEHVIPVKTQYTRDIPLANDWSIDAKDYYINDVNRFRLYEGFTLDGYAPYYSRVWCYEIYNDGTTYLQWSRSTTDDYLALLDWHIDKHIREELI